MATVRRLLLSLSLFFTVCSLAAQDSAVFRWEVSARRTGEGAYELQFKTAGASGWELYAAGQDLLGVLTTELKLNDSSIRVGSWSAGSGVAPTKSAIFEGLTVGLQRGPATWTVPVTFGSPAPAFLKGTLLYTYGKGEELYPGTALPFSVALEGGVSKTSDATILRPAIDIRNPVAPCGDESTEDQSIWSIFFIGLGAGLLALLFPCIFPLIPLTVSFFTKRAPTRRRGVRNAFFYGFSIFAIYTALSLPFHLFQLRPEVLNNISTNVPLNLAFFLVFVIFAISFFGVFEITLPSGLANKVDSKSGAGDIWGIFFMALTLTIVSFSCTSGILGALIAGSLSGSNAAWQLTAGMAGFGLGLGLPFVLFALFPGWLQSMPRSGGWMTELKVVFGFIELAMAIKFLSNADLVKDWGILPREVFLGLWIVIGICTVAYLLGALRKGPRPKMGAVRGFFVLIFAATTLYMIPGLFNVRSAGLTLISGFPPPLTYSVYKPHAALADAVKPLHNDYEGALRRARAEGKPVLIDFTGKACVNCRKMEERVWTDERVSGYMKDSFVVVSLYVDDRSKLPANEQQQYKSRRGDLRDIITVGDKWATFQSENFFAVSQPQYAILSPDEKALTRPKTYTEDAADFRDWLDCGLNAYRSAGPR
ncbi:protein-disulfide reductase DsbD family protein [Flaviaesturariibacter amylovorans]|uniref:Thioredoxin family protein n=1 Tax=Flaviaesturariibacter amylovorans TaxID=1084520 RepID=A0ABP8HCY2_9BACT